MRFGYTDLVEAKQHTEESSGWAENDEKTVQKRVLVVDDDPSLGELLGHIFKLAGYQAVDIVESADSALRLFQPGRYSLVTTDLNMPKMNGLQLARTLKTSEASLPILLISGSLEKADFTAEQLTSVDAMLAKPFDVKELLAAIAKIVKGSQAITR